MSDMTSYPEKDVTTREQALISQKRLEKLRRIREPSNLSVSLERLLKWVDNTGLLIADDRVECDLAFARKSLAEYKNADDLTPTAGRRG